jgi:acetyltransferase EpsM
MMEAIIIKIPLISPNEPGARLAAVYVINGQHVEEGERLCALETTKATVELYAEQEGFLAGLSASQGQTLQAGDTFAYLAETAEWTPPAFSSPPARPESALGDGLRISHAARLLAKKHHLDLSQLSADVFITEKMVQELIDQSAPPLSEFLAQQYKPNDLIIYGGGGHGKALIDLIRSLGTYAIVGIVDDGLPVGSIIMGVPVLGSSSVLRESLRRGLRLAANAVGGIGNITSRITVFERLVEVGFSCPTLIHPAAFFEPSSSLADGVQVMPHAYVGSETRVGFGAIINTGTIVSHDCVLGDYSNLSPGAILAGEVRIGRATLIGMGVTVNLRVQIGENVRIGNGATVKQDVPDGAVVRAGSTWPE